MNKDKVVRWLDRMAKVTNQFCNIKSPYKAIQRCGQLYQQNMPCVQLYTGLHEIAELLGLEVAIEYESQDDICYRFIYNGVKFIQLEDKEVVE